MNSGKEALIQTRDNLKVVVTELESILLQYRSEIEQLSSGSSLDETIKVFNLKNNSIDILYDIEKARQNILELDAQIKGEW